MFTAMFLHFFKSDYKFLLKVLLSEVVHAILNCSCLYMHSKYLIEIHCPNVAY